MKLKHESIVHQKIKNRSIFLILFYIQVEKLECLRRILFGFIFLF